MHTLKFAAILIGSPIASLVSSQFFFVFKGYNMWLPIDLNNEV